MALIKCSECSQDISDKAFLCPHCGNPIQANSVSTEEISPPVDLSADLKESKKVFSSNKAIRSIVVGVRILIILVVALLITIFLFSFQTSSADSLIQRIANASHNTIQTLENAYSFIRSSKSVLQIQNNGLGNSPQITQSIQQSATNTTTNSLTVQVNQDGSKTYPVQRVDLWGYQFYTSKIDQSGNVDIGSEAKQKIAGLLKSLPFPPSLTGNLIIMNIDPTLVTSRDNVKIPWAGQSNATISLQPEGGTYQGVYNGSVIALNNRAGYDLSILTHELGHLIGFRLTDDEWNKYYELRSIPANTPRQTSNPELSPTEDFAEVYRVIYYDGQPIKTNYGILVGNDSSLMLSKCSSIFLELQRNWLAKYGTIEYGTYNSNEIEKAGNAVQSNPQLQACREKNPLNIFTGSQLYTRQITDGTKQFVASIVQRLSK